MFRHHMGGLKQLSFLFLKNPPLHWSPVTNVKVERTYAQPTKAFQLPLKDHMRSGTRSVPLFLRFQSFRRDDGCGMSEVIFEHVLISYLVYCKR